MVKANTLSNGEVQIRSYGPKKNPNKTHKRVLPFLKRQLKNYDVKVERKSRRGTY